MEDRILDGRYQLGQLLGRGGMGAVWEAHDLRLERQVAVKVVGISTVGSDPRAAQRFEREAKLLAGLTSPYIVTVHDVGESRLDGQRILYLVMERLYGRSLEHVLTEELPPLDEVARWGEQICRALEVAHEAGVVHRDLKPANVMVEPDGLARVLDFGIAAVLADNADHVRLTSTGVVVGTPAYMAPEQIETGSVEARSDLYALGCVLYALATGRPPFYEGSLYSLFQQQMESMADPPSEVRAELPQEWDELVLSLLAKRPEERPESAAEVAGRLRELATLSADLPGSAHAVATPDEDGGYEPTRIDPRAAAPFISGPGDTGSGLRLLSGQRTWLTDLLPALDVLDVILDWEAPEGVDVDASALIVDEDGQVLSDDHFIFYNNHDSGDGSLWLDEEEGEGEARLGFSATSLDERVCRIVFAVSIHDGQELDQHLSMVRTLRLRLFDPSDSEEESGGELLSYGLPQGPPHSTGVTLGELYRSDRGWAFHAVSRGYAGGLAEIAEAHGVNIRGGE